MGVSLDEESLRQKKAEAAALKGLTKAEKKEYRKQLKKRQRAEELEYAKEKGLPPPPKKSKKEPRLGSFPEGTAPKGLSPKCYVETSDWEVEMIEGYRLVKPYHHKFEVFAKESWCGRNVLDTFADLFTTESREEHRSGFESGKISCRGHKCSPDHVVKTGDYFSKTQHLHEAPARSDDIVIVHETPDYLVVDKPSSLVVHPSGSCKHLTLTHLLAKEKNINNIYCIHRLDKATSGLVLFGRHIQAATSLSDRFKQGGMIEKCYLAEVQGCPISGDFLVTAPLDTSKLVVCVSDAGKDSKTAFRRLSYNKDKDTSIMLCYPITGRTHQIRVHLKHIGHPIVNDYVYNPQAAEPEPLNLDYQLTSEEKDPKCFSCQKHRYNYHVAPDVRTQAGKSVFCLHLHAIRLYSPGSATPDIDKDEITRASLVSNQASLQERASSYNGRAHLPFMVTSSNPTWCSCTLPSSEGLLFPNPEALPVRP